MVYQKKDQAEFQCLKNIKYSIVILLSVITPKELIAIQFLNSQPKEIILNLQQKSFKLGILPIKIKNKTR